MDLYGQLKLKIPILIVGGTSDAQIGIEHAQQLSKANPNANLNYNWEFPLWKLTRSGRAVFTILE